MVAKGSSALVLDSLGRKYSIRYTARYSIVSKSSTHFFRPDLSLKTEGGSAGHLRCGKGSTWEGGVRIPAIAWWAEKVRHGRTHQLSSMLDLFPTLMKMAGGKVPQDRIMDGLDLSNVLFVKNGKVRTSYCIVGFFPVCRY